MSEGQDGARSAGQSPSLARQFVLAAALVLLFGMGAIGFWVSTRIEEAVTHNAAAATALYVDSIIAPLTQDMAQSHELTEGAKLALRETLSQGVLSQKMFSFKIWTPDGTIVFSNEESLVGKRFPMTEACRKRERADPRRVRTSGRGRKPAGKPKRDSASGNLQPHPRTMVGPHHRRRGVL